MTSHPLLPGLLVPGVWLALMLPASALEPHGNEPHAAPENTTLDDVPDFTELSLEELMSIEITVASRSPQSLLETPAAVYVLTGDEIRRSGHSSVQEALRMVPGFYVSHWTNAQWDVTTRGFGTETALTNLAFHNQLLVMIDGVVVYTPLFAGVWWALQDIDLADLERIEVIRGPGGIVWGSNAVHGVVHIITKSASDTQGARTTFHTGKDEWHASARYGGALGDQAHFRVWGKAAQYETPHNPYLGFPQDHEIQSGGFRADWSDDGGRTYNLSGRAYDSRFENIGFDLMTFDPFSSRDDKLGGQLQWSMTDPETATRWQAWYSLDKQDIDTLVDIEIESVDLEVQRMFEFSEESSLNVGAGYRRIDSRLQGDDPFYLAFTPEQQVQDNFRAFATHTLRFPDQKAELLFGLQVEQTAFTGFEVQPSVRGTLHPNETTVLWGAISRAVRTPSLEEESLSADSAITGDPAFRSEEVLAYEVGLRRKLGERASADLTVFYNSYDDLRLDVFDDMTFQTLVTNQAEGHAYGAELALDVRPNERWNLRGAASYQTADLTSKIDGSALDTDDRSPRYLFNLRSYYDLGEHWELDAGFYLVDGLGDDLRVAEYQRLDGRVGWSPSESLRLAVGVQNANHAIHSEYDSFDNPRRSVFLTLEWTP